MTDEVRLSMEWEKLDEGELKRLAARVAALLEPGDVVVLSGEVGSGKTTFVRAAMHALGVRERVTSPTYQLARSYEGEMAGSSVTLNHLDLYRLEEIGSADVLELEDYLEPGAITFIEWADPALGSLEAPSLVELSHQGEGLRGVRITGPLEERLGGC